MTTERISAAPVAGGWPRRAGRRLLRWLPALVLPLVGLVVWQLACWAFSPREWLLPSPFDIAGSLWDDRSTLWFNARATIRETLVGLTLATVLGLGLAIAMAALRTVDRIAGPWVVASQTLPVIALAPFFGIWLDYGPAQVMTAALISFFPIVVTGIDGLRGVDPTLSESARTLGAGRFWVWRRITFPGALPSLFSGLKLAAVFAVTGAIVAEYIGADRGLGYLTRIATSQFETSLAFAAVFWLGAIGFALYLIVGGIERLALPYRHRPTRPDWRHR